MHKPLDEARLHAMIELALQQPQEPRIAEQEVAGPDRGAYRWVRRQRGWLGGLAACVLLLWVVSVGGLQEPFADMLWQRHTAQPAMPSAVVAKAGPVSTAVRTGDGTQPQQRDAGEMPDVDMAEWLVYEMMDEMV